MFYFIYRTVDAVRNCIYFTGSYTLVYTIFIFMPTAEIEKLANRQRETPHFT